MRVIAHGCSVRARYLATFALHSVQPFFEYLHLQQPMVGTLLNPLGRGVGADGAEELAPEGAEELSPEGSGFCTCFFVGAGFLAGCPMGAAAGLLRTAGG